MTTAPLHVNPEIAELFDEIRRDPDSSLFRFEHRRRRGLGEERDVMVRPSATGLSAAERELLVVHREEAAWLLREAFLLRIAEDPGVAIDYGGVGGARDANEFRRSVGNHRAALQADAASIPEGDVLEACERADHGSWPSLLELTLSSLRLVDTDHGRIYCAIALERNQEPLAARRLLWALLSRGHRPQLRGYVWQNLGFLHDRIGEDRESLRAFQRATREEGVRAEVWVNLLIKAIRIEDLSTALHSSKVIDQKLSEGEPEIERYVTILSLGRPDRAPIGLQSSRVRDRVLRTAGPAARRILCEVS